MTEALLVYLVSPLVGYLEYLRPYTPIVLGILAATLTVFTIDLVKLFLHKTPAEREAAMAVSKQRRKNWVRRYIQYQISELLEEAYYRKRITMGERDEWAKLIGAHCNMPDLMPKKRPVQPIDPDLLVMTLKSLIRERSPHLAAKVDAKNNKKPLQMVFRKKASLTP